MARVTLTLDDAAAATLRHAAQRLRKSQSEVVRDAIANYATRIGHLTKRERVRLLDVFDQFVLTLPRRPLRNVEAEVANIRAARRAGGRRS